MRLRWSLQARDDLKQIREYISRDKPEAARHWVQRLRVRAQDAARRPHAGRVVPEFNRDDLREALVGNYRIVYRIERGAIIVLTVFDGHKTMGGSSHGKQRSGR